MAQTAASDTLLAKFARFSESDSPQGFLGGAAIRNPFALLFALLYRVFWGAARYCLSFCSGNGIWRGTLSPYLYIAGAVLFNPIFPVDLTVAGLEGDACLEVSKSAVAALAVIVWF